MPEQMSLQDFGQKIKAQYPAYANFSDTAIAQKVLEKYPQYKASIRPATPADAASLRAEAEKRRPIDGVLKPAEAGASAWLGDVEQDLRQGGGRTAVGRELGRMQGRGERGYSGLESGTSKGVGEFMGSVPLGLTLAAQGVAETPKHPVRGPLKAVGGALEASTIPSAFVGGPVASKAIEAVPSAKYAGQVLKAVEQSAGHLPVDLGHAAEPLLRIRDLADRGGTMPQAVRKLLARATEPNGAPVTFSELRDFYSNVTSLSAREKMNLAPVMRRELGRAAAGLTQDLAATAAKVNRSADYLAGMKEYAQAKKLQRVGAELGKWLVRAGGVGATAALAKLVWDAAPKAAAGIRQ